MKKTGLLLGLLSAGLLTGCVMPAIPGVSGNTSTPTSEPTSAPTSEPTSAPTSEVHDVEAETRAINAAKAQTLATVSRNSDIIEGVTSDIGWGATGFYNNDYLFLTTKQMVADRETEKDFYVNIEWSYDKTDAFVKEELVTDDTHIAVYFNYDKEQEHDFPFKATLKCGEGTPAEVNFQVHLKTRNLDFKQMSIPEIYAVNDTNDGFKEVDAKTGYYPGNNTSIVDETTGKPKFNYLCVETTGQVIYTAPDGNWGLIADGDSVLELYSGSASNIDAGHFPALVVGEVVKVQAELGSYYGNCQVSFIFDISKGDRSAITAPTNYALMRGQDFAGKKYFEGGLMNSLRTVNAVYNGNLKDKNDKDISVSETSAGARWTFEVKVDGEVLKVAYDYHVDRKGEAGVYNAFKAKLESLSVGDALTLKGTVRFAGTNQKTYLNQDKGVWSIVPFLADHMA